MSAPVIGFAGMTHLGLVSGVCAAEKGFRLVCFDPDPVRIAAIASRNLPVSEPQLAELLAGNAQRLAFTVEAADLSACDVICVAPDVSTDSQGASDLVPSMRCSMPCSMRHARTRSSCSCRRCRRDTPVAGGAPAASSITRPKH